MAIVEVKTIESSDGVKKTIDGQSMGMALDILQRGLYAFPIKSTVRELASNAHDAVKERDVAKAIIAGLDKVEDHFDVTKAEEGIYHASGWDPTYFDLDWLSDDPYVRIYYEEGKLRDTLRIVDNGVGLGGSRLLGYFQINYSSKRANKDTLGRFGLGSKVPLSLGVESFRVINRYNGKKFKFDVYLDKIESSVPKFGAGRMNEAVQLTEEVWEVNKDTGEKELVKPAYLAYWEPTQEKNGVEVQVEIKKHNKNAFFEGIESQLMYMPGILFMHRPEGGINHKTIDIKAQIAYRDDNVIIAKSNVYDKPHILLGTGEVMINYGFVAFNELEIEPKGGAVGLIMDINEIEVTPSREAPVWSALTRKAVLEKYEKVTEVATKYVNQEIQKETDYIKWIQKATSIMGSIKNNTADSSSVLATLASIIDVSHIKNIQFAPDKTITLENDIEKMFGKGYLIREIQYERWARKIKRDKVKDVQSLNYPLYYTKVGANKYKDRYIYEEKGRFVLINEKESADIFDRYDLIKDSDAWTDYDTLEVPEDRLAIYLDNDDKDDDDEDNDLPSTSSIDRAAIRKVNKEIVVHFGQRNYHGEWVFSTVDKKVSDMFSINPGCTVLYGTGNDRNTLKSLMGYIHSYYTTTGGKRKFFDALPENQVGMQITTDDDDDGDSGEDASTKLTSILVAKENLKYISSSSRFKTPYQLVVEGYNPRNGKLVLSKEIMYTLTAMMVKAMMEDTADGETKKYGGYSFFYQIARSVNLKSIFQEDEDDALTFEFLSSCIYPHESSMDKIPDTEFVEFLSMLGKYQLMETGRVTASEEDKEKLLEEINENLPDFMCEDIDTITSVKAVKLDLFDDSINLIERLLRSWGIIFLYDSKHYYQSDERENMGEAVKEFISMKDNEHDALL